MTVVAQLIESKALLSVVVASLVAGGGLTIAFSAMIVCVTRAAEQRRAGNPVWATALTVAAILALLLCVGLVFFGLRLMVTD